MINLRVLQIKQSKPPLQHWQIVTKGLKYIKKQFLYTPNTEANHDRIMNEFERFFQQNYEIVKSFNIHKTMMSPNIDIKFTVYDSPKTYGMVLTMK